MRWMIALILSAAVAHAAPRDVTFTNIDGGSHHMGAWAGQPVLVVNTASQCGFTGQYADLQALHETYAARGLVVLAVPSDDFNQELASGAEVKEFCETTFGLDLPMTDITHVRGARAHPFYRAVKAETGFEPGWNFNKVLVAPDGRVAGTWGASTKPMSDDILGAIEGFLADR